MHVYLGGALELQHAGVVVGFACCCLGGADEVSQGFGHILHGINEDHLQTARMRVSTLISSARMNVRCVSLCIQSYT